MCGICGIKGMLLKERKDCLGQMTDVLYHRGPDEKGEYSDDNISLGIRRLSIIDPEGGSQPIFNEDRTVTVISNGEIYNFMELKKDLIEKGHSFYTASDTEVLVHLYEAHGTGMLDLIKGMFSFAIWDKNKERLFIARDRFGIKPLYYYNKNGRFAFASELKSLLKLPFLEKRMNKTAINLYFSMEYVPSPHSVWEDIHKLMPAHYLLYEKDRLTVNRYWDLKDDAPNADLRPGQAEDMLEVLLEASIKEHLISDVPLGIFLSGGIDSSAIAALACRYSGRISTFSIGFEERSFDESGFAFKVARRLGTEHYSYKVTIKDIMGTFRDLTTYLDEPFADLSVFPTYILSKFSRTRIKVALSGEGGDELFMGYQTYAAHNYMDLLNRSAPRLKPVFNIANSLPASFEYFSLDFKLKQFAKGMRHDNPIDRHVLWMSSFDEREKDDLFVKGFNEGSPKNRMGSAYNLAENILRGRNGAEACRQIQYLDIFTYLTDDLLVKSDRASMFSSLEVRVPYLDHKLVEFVRSLDIKLIYQKRLLKKIMKGVLPDAILRRPKKGFPIPFSFWIKDPGFFNLVKEFFDKGFITGQGIFNHGYINRLLEEHLSNKKDNRKKLRTYIMFQAWYRQWNR